MHYYNEYDKHAAAWLRELIAQKLIPAGEVDERSILDVQPDDLRPFTQCHFFAGIGGWPYALRLAGIPATRRLWTGSCPCQPFSTAGQQKGQEDERHLWPAFFNLIRECRPPTIFGEQVASSLVVGPSNPPRSMPDLRDRKTLLRILSELERESPRNLQGMRQSKGKAAQKASTCKDQRSVQEMAGREKRTCTCERGEAPSKKTPHSFQHNTGGHSKPHQSWSVRSDGDTLRPSQTQSVECSLPGSNRTQSRIHAGEHQSGVVCRECDGQLLGVAENRGSVERDSEWEERSLEQIIGSDNLKAQLSNVGSMEYRQTWKLKTTPAGRQYWAHTASAHPTSGKGCTGWPTTTRDHKDGSAQACQNVDSNCLLGRVVHVTPWPTPTTGDSASSRNSTANRKIIPPTGIHKGDTLTDAVTLASWATPDANAMNLGEGLETWDARQEKNKTKHGNGNGAGMPLSIQSQTITGWRSPAAGDCKMRISNTEMADKRAASGKQISLELEAPGVTQPSSTAETGKSGASQLNPAFSLWLMGFPAEWAYCGAAAMQLSRKRQPRSSKQVLKPSVTRYSGSGEDPLAGVW